MLENKFLFILIIFFPIACCQSKQEKYPINIPPYLGKYDTAAFDTLYTSRVELGKMLFESQLLSENNTISCQSCHLPSLAFTDGKSLSEGIFGRHSRHNSTTLFNIAFHPTFMWDNRAQKLEIQPLIPIHDSAEMNMNINDLPEKLNKNSLLKSKCLKTYQSEFTPFLITDALAAFMRSLVRFDRPIDSFIVLGNYLGWDSEMQLGYALFMGKANCNSCHTLPHSSNFQHYNLGLEPAGGGFGLMGKTLNKEDFQRFKTPTLRYVSITSPYFHNGSAQTLEEVVEFKTNPKSKTKDFTPIVLSKEEKKALVRFLKEAF